jgi:molybdopterin adenylyltransferase
MLTVAIIVASDTRSKGINRDEVIPAIKSFIEKQNWQFIDSAIVPDEKKKLKEKLIYYADTVKVDLILTSGGTGFSKRDVTPEATKEVIEKETPGYAEAMRMKTFDITPLSILSRATAGIRGNTLIINLPGNPKGAIECLNVIKEAIPHGIEIIQGRLGNNGKTFERIKQDTGR